MVHPRIASLACQQGKVSRHSISYEISLTTTFNFIEKHKHSRHWLTTMLVAMSKCSLVLSLLCHSFLDREDPLVEYEFEEIKTAIALDREAAQNVGWLSLVKTAGNRKRMRIILALAFFSQWSGNGLV